MLVDAFRLLNDVFVLKINNDNSMLWTKMFVIPAVERMVLDGSSQRGRCTVGNDEQAS